MIIQKITNFLKQNKKIFFYVGFFIYIYYLFTDFTFAVETTSNVEKFNEIKQTVSTVAEGLLKGISLLLALITYLATVFLSPSWYNGSLFGMNSYFKDIWILVSNVVYFVFAFILIWIAFMNIIGRNADQYQLKQALPKFIVGVLIVPFSWFLIQFILSISAVLTVASLSLPFDTFDDFSSKLEGVKIPINCELNLESFVEGKEVEGKSEGFISCDKDEANHIPITDIAGSGDSIDSIFGIIAMYTYGILSLDTVDDLSTFDLNSVKTMGDLIVKIVFDLLFVVIYSILMIALGLVLMIRGIYIWIYTMISPVFGLMYFFDKKEGAGEGFFSKFNVKEFIALAMVPVYTMLALSFGLLFLFVVGEGIAGGGGSEKEQVFIEEDGLKVGQFNLKIIGPVSTINNTTGLLTEIGGTGLGIVGSLILKIFGIVILWGTVMAGMRSSEVTKTITQPLHDFGAKVGQIAMSGPGNLPIFGGQSMKSMGNIAGKVQGHIDNKTLDRANSFTGKHMPFLGGDGAQMIKELQGINNNLKSNVGGGKDPNIAKLEEWKKFISATTSTGKIAGNTSAQDTLKELAKSVGIKDSDIKDLTNKTNVATLMGDIEVKFEDTLTQNALKGKQKGEVLSADSMDRLMKEFSQNGSSNDNPDNGNNGIDLESQSSDGVNKYKVDNKFFVDVKGNNIEGGESNYKDLAKHIFNKNMDEKSMKDFFSKLSIDGDLTDIKKEIAKYFKDGELKAGQDDGDVGDLNKFLDKNKPDDN